MPADGFDLTSSRFSSSSSFWLSLLSDSSEQLLPGSEVWAPEELHRVEVTIEGNEMGGEGDGEEAAVLADAGKRALGQAAVVRWERCG